jgi:uncharacterized protein YkwD
MQMQRTVMILLAIVTTVLPGVVIVHCDDKKQSASQSLGTAVMQPAINKDNAPEGYTLQQLEFFEKYCFTEVNHYREGQHLAPLLLLPEALTAARHYSRRMAEEGFFSHTDPQGASARERLLQAGIKYVTLGENLSRATGYLDPVPDVVKNWTESSYHRANIMNSEYKYAAVGAWVKDNTFFFTEIFLSR